MRPLILCVRTVAFALSLPFLVSSTGRVPTPAPAPRTNKSANNKQQYRPPRDAAPVPASILFFVADGKDLTILVYQFAAVATSPAQETFHGRPVVKVTELDAQRTAAALQCLMSASSYSPSHIACVGAAGTGVGVSLRRADQKLDLFFDICKHVLNAESRQTIAALSDSGYAVIERMAGGAHINPCE